MNTDEIASTRKVSNDVEEKDAEQRRIKIQLKILCIQKTCNEEAG
jgi:hypothetical protein